MRCACSFLYQAPVHLAYWSVPVTNNCNEPTASRIDVHREAAAVVEHTKRETLVHEFQVVRPRKRVRPHVACAILGEVQSAGLVYKWQLWQFLMYLGFAKYAHVKQTIRDRMSSSVHLACTARSNNIDDLRFTSYRMLCNISSAVLPNSPSPCYIYLRI